MAELAENVDVSKVIIYKYVKDMEIIEYFKEDIRIIGG